MKKLTVSYLVLLFCYSSSRTMQYPADKAPTIPVQGYRSTLRFFTKEQLEQISQKASYMSQFAGLYTDDLENNVNSYNFLQLPIEKSIMELLPKLAEIDCLDSDALSKFLRKNSFSIHELARATLIIAYHCYHKTVDSLVITPRREASGVLKWEPPTPQPGLGWITIQLINDQLTIYPHDGNFTRIVNCSTGEIESRSKYES